MDQELVEAYGDGSREADLFKTIEVVIPGKLLLQIQSNSLWREIGLSQS